MYLPNFILFCNNFKVYEFNEKLVDKTYNKPKVILIYKRIVF